MGMLADKHIYFNALLAVNNTSIHPHDQNTGYKQPCGFSEGTMFVLYVAFQTVVAGKHANWSRNQVCVTAGLPGPWRGAHSSFWEGVGGEVGLEPQSLRVSFTGRPPCQVTQHSARELGRFVL